jgi:ELWxxDGT repeat protein
MNVAYHASSLCLALTILPLLGMRAVSAQPAGVPELVEDFRTGSDDPVAVTVHQWLSTPGRLYFTRWEEAHGFELWQTDGAPSGTSLVRDLEPGIRSSAPAGLLPFGDGALFMAFGSTTELWSTNGTPPGTRLLQHSSERTGTVGPVAFGAGRAAFVSCEDELGGCTLFLTGRHGARHGADHRAGAVAPSVLDPQPGRGRRSSVLDWAG